MKASQINHFQIQDIISEENFKKILERGFLVYDHVSIKDLLSTIFRDYYYAVTRVHILTEAFLFFFAIAFVFMLSTQREYEILIALLVLVGFFLLVYTAVTIYTFIRLYKRTKIFFETTKIIFTSEGLFLGDTFYKYNGELLRRELKKNEREFNTSLSQNLELEKSNKLLKKDFIRHIVGGELNNQSDNIDWIYLFFMPIKLILLTFTLVICLTLSIIPFIIYIIWTLYKLRKTKLNKIKKQLDIIERENRNLLELEKKLEIDLTDLNRGYIDLNNKRIQNNFRKFYKALKKVIKQGGILSNMVKQSFYSKQINMTIFFEYTKNKYTKPVMHLITVLKQRKIAVLNQIKDIENISDKQNNNELKSPLLKKEIHLKLIEDNINKMIQKLQSIQ